MYRLSQLIGFFILFTQLIYSQNPHGDDLKIDCAVCHTSDSWKVDFNKIDFDHETTSFALNGKHSVTDCRNCHGSLIFSEVKNDCADCHTDIHNNTVLRKCSDCHSEDDWLIEDIPVLHEEYGFDLSGAHIYLSCEECHIKSPELIFEPLSPECYACHEANYEATTSPDHVEGNFSLDCNTCHDVDGDSWIISHDFFPLEKGHNLKECSSCHSGSSYMDASPDCYSCHSEDYDNTVNPDHQTGSFSENCSECHTIDPGWSPAKYENHDENNFPVFSGKHKGEWSQCTDCHIDPNNYSAFTCLDCHAHEKTKMDDKHDDVGDYIYESQACLYCHPDGS